ncbi:putative bifunctional diguanylate cyclase/phosphodiesterase [Pelomicrobium methylotrophicum]|uniref:EAL domain-containing protein n=1 Tax=Pelomicrobium methylotrophicum TaxID=2602750 RepID=A0A5C7EKN9_9PROT|nr:EAL domain-containing protein [Pelomicrobium methylotrophicum]TXF11948.1 EAL domain-containing protein [Pelomicrobium methylotrophicum]
MFAIAWIGGDALLLRRANALVSAARRLAAGDLTARTGLPAGDDEIARVAGAFDEMAEALARQLERITQLNRTHAMLSAINGAILRIRDRDLLLKEACRIAVEFGGLPLAWVAMIDPEAGRLRPVAKAGVRQECEACVERFIAPLPPAAAPAEHPLAIAVREGRAQVCNDIAHDPGMAPWREDAAAAGIAATAALPLRIKGQVVGVLGLCAAQADFFDEEELQLIEEVAADVSLGLEYIEKDRQLHHLAYYDPLTGLPKAALFEDRLAHALARLRHQPRSLAVVVLESEDFRRTARELGRHVSDRLLQEVARHLCAGVREGDTVAWLGGGQFGVLLTDVGHAQGAMGLASKLVSTLPREVSVNGMDVFLQVRAGVAIYPDDGTEPEVLIRHARIALGAPRVEVGNTVSFFAPGLDAAAQERRRITQALHRAIERGEFALHYQPVIDLAARRMTGAEALVRWHSAELGPLSPATFIPIAEETGLIVPLGRWVLEEGCRQAVRWQAQGRAGLRIAVNVSAKQLYQPDFLDEVNAILDASGVSGEPSLLAIEVTESALMEDIETSIAVLQRLKGRGLSVYVDDFGTGYSSLAYLKRLPADKLKIDISFVRGMLSDRSDYTIVATIIAMARSLGLKTLAEGVEEAAQVEALSALGCDEVQGYYFGRPEPPDAFARKWLAGNAS